MNIPVISRISLIALLTAGAFLLGQYSARTVAAESHPVWQYKIINDDSQELNRLGADGWEAVNMTEHRILVKRSN